jgi:hypothetical protein
MKILLKIVLLITVLISASVQAYLTPVEQQEIIGYAYQARSGPLYNNHRVKVSSSLYLSNRYTLLLKFDVDDKGYKVEDMRTDLNNTMVKKIANHWCSYAFDDLIKKGLMIDLRFFSKENGGKFMDNIVNHGTCGAIKTGWYKPEDYANNFDPVEEKLKVEKGTIEAEKRKVEKNKLETEKLATLSFKDRHPGLKLDGVKKYSTILRKFLCKIFKTSTSKKLRLKYITKMENRSNKKNPKYNAPLSFIYKAYRDAAGDPSKIVNVPLNKYGF